VYYVIKAFYLKIALFSKIVTLLVKQSNFLSILTRLGCIPSLLTELIFWKNFQGSERLSIIAAVALGLHVFSFVM